MPPSPHVVAMAAEGTNLRLTWSDGHVSVYPPRHLRFLCSCAGCVDEVSGVRRVAWESIPADIHPLQAEPVGRYAIRIAWSDGHATGLYTFEHLRAICPCPACAGEKGTADGHR